jgi:hypothetical protein
MPDIVKPLNTSEVSEYLHDTWNIKRTKKTLEKDRCRGDGPEWFYVGKIPFSYPAWVDAWVLARTTDKVRSATEGRQARLKQKQSQKLTAPGPNDLPSPI